MTKLKIQLIKFQKISDNKVIVFASVLDKKSKLKNFFEKSKDAVCVACYEDTENQLKNLILKNSLV